MASNESEIQEQMQQQMKKRLENLPRLTYRITKFFQNKSDLQKAIDDLNNNGISNLRSRELTENYVEEIYEVCIFFKEEGKTVLKFAVYGAIIGIVLGLIHGMGFIALPLLNPISSAGMFISTILMCLIISVISASFAAITMIFKPIKKIQSGYYMLTVYSDYENKQTIDNLLNKHVNFDI